MRLRFELTLDGELVAELPRDAKTQ
jgi:hypothetical protein